MKAVDNNNAPPVVEYDGTPRRLYMHCRFCRHNWSTWTRRGLRARCPNCGRVVEGPEKVRQMIEGEGRKAAATVTPIRIATDTTSTAPVATAPKPAKKATAPAPPAAKKTPPPPAAPPPAQQRGGLLDIVGKALGY